MKLALFDFDGTIIRVDSLIKFVRFVKGDLKTAWGIFILSPILILYKLKIIPNYRAKQWLLSYFLKGMNEQDFLTRSTEFSLHHIDSYVRPKAIERILWHKQQGHKVVVVSASIESWLKPWCEKHNLDIIATKIEIKDGTVTGKFLTKNCHAKEKYDRVKEAYNISDYDYIYAYGDSCGDKELLELANESFYKPFTQE